MAYIYEYIRTRGHEPIYFEEHYARLDALALTHYLEHLKVTREELRGKIAERLYQARFSSTVVNTVCVKYSPEGEVEVEPIEMIYNAFSLRALRPQAYICRVYGDILMDNTSAKDALLEFNRSTAEISNEGVAVWVNEQGEVTAIDGSSVVAVFDGEIRFSRMGSGVEFEVAYRATEKMKRNATKGAILIDELPKAKELLYIDYRGITALVGWDKRHYTDITAERIAKQVAESEASQIF